MNWKLFGSTFSLVFLAELGDKTQLATMALSAGQQSRLPVFLGAASALTLTSLLAVCVGGELGRFVPTVYLHRAAGALFVVMGVLLLAGYGE